MTISNEADHYQYAWDAENQSVWHGDGAVEDMQQSVEQLGEAVIGHRIVKVERSNGDWWGDNRLNITLDNGKRVSMEWIGSDCCAYTELEKFLFNVDHVDHVITGIKTEGVYSTWHIYADMGDVLQLDVDWSEGNYGYYAFGFNVKVQDEAGQE